MTDDPEHVAQPAAGGLPDPDASAAWIFTLYGATMLAVQGTENAICFLYIVISADPEKTSNASPERQWKAAFEKLWAAFQKGSAGMKLNDANRGIKPHLDPELAQQLETFITTRRNDLAHRFLIERVVPGGDGRFVPGSALHLIETTMQAKRLTEAIQNRATEILSSWPEPERPPQDVAEAALRATNFAMRKNYPLEVRNDIHGIG